MKKSSLFLARRLEDFVRSKKRQLHTCNYVFGRVSRLKTERFNRSFQEGVKDDLIVHDYGKPNIQQKRIYTFGYAEHGAIGLPNLSKPSLSHQKRMQYMHKPVRNVFSQYVNVIDIACGHGFSLFAIKPKHGISPLFGCGLNHFSQLGYQAVRSNAPMEVLLSIVPITLPKLKTQRITSLGAGLGHSVVAFQGEGLLTFGDNSKGQCGRRIIEDEKYFGSKYVHKIPPFGSTPDYDVVEIATRFYSTFCRTENGKLYSFGSNAKGLLGRGKQLDKCYAPAQILGDIEHQKITKISTSGSTALAISANGELFGWGCNEYGLVDPSSWGGNFYFPKAVKLPSSIGKVTDVALGDTSAYILNHIGNVYVWGQGSSLGLGPNIKLVTKPRLIPPPLFGRNDFSSDVEVVKLHSSFFYAGVINSIGDVYTWGKNIYGCLGLGAVEFQPFPFKVALGAKAEKLAFGVDHSVILTKGGF